MQSKHNFEAINQVFQNICNRIVNLGRKIVYFYKDFRQTLPMIPQRLSRQIINKCLKKTFFWEKVKISSLSINI